MTKLTPFRSVFWSTLSMGLIVFLLAGCQQISQEDLPVSEPIVVPTRSVVAEVVEVQVEKETETQVPTQTIVPTEEPPTIEATIEETVEPTATMTPSPEPTPRPLPGTELFTFTAGEPGWYTVDDDVMGGVSSSDVMIVEPNQLYFSGTMSLDNNGGFSSVRSDWNMLDLTGNDGVILRVKGDGNVYRFRIRTDSAGRGISYNALFKTTADTWTTVFVPFAEMVPTYRGFVMDVGPLDPATIGSFGFMLSDKQPGEFELLVDWVRAVSSQDIGANVETSDA